MLKGEMMMKKTIKTIMTVFAIAFALCATSVTAEAAKKENVTLYVGEKPTYSFVLGNVKSVKTSNKKVVSVKKSKGNAVLKANKTGKAKITVTGSYRNSTNILNVTVKKKPTFELSCYPVDNDYILIKVKNNSKAFLDTLKLDLTFYDTSGNEVKNLTKYINYIGAGKTAYEKAYVYADYSTIDFSKTKLVSEYDRSLSYKYKDYTSKVKYSITYSNGYANVTTKTSYKKDGGVYAAFNLAYKDAAGNIIGYYYDSYNYLYKSKKTSTNQYSMPEGAVSAEIIGKRAMLKESKR